MRLIALLCLAPSLAFALPAEVQLMPKPDALELVSRPLLSWAGGSFEHVDQSLEGLPVYGERLTVSYDRSGAVRAIHGKPLVAAPLSLDPYIDQDEAIERAKFGAVQFGSGEMWPPRAELAILQLDGAHLAWVIDLGLTEPGPKTWQVFVDAHDGTLLAARPTSFEALGSIYPTNPETSEVENAELAGVTTSLSNGFAVVQSCDEWDEDARRCVAKSRHAQPDDDGNFIYAPSPSSQHDPFAEVQMFFHLDLVSRWFDDMFGFRVQFGVSNAIEGIVNFLYNNAFFGDADGDGYPEVAFGQFGFYDYAYDADVVYHEFGHAVFGQIVDSGYGRFDEYGRSVGSGGLNEGSADFFSMVLTQDPNLGEYAGQINGTGPIRQAEADRQCPEDIYGETHRDGEIWASLGWNLIDHDEIGPELAAQLVFGAMNTWPADPTFHDAGTSVLASAEAMYDEGLMSDAQVELIEDLLIAQGFDDCGRVVALDDGADPVMMMTGYLDTNFQLGFPLPNQFSLDAPDGTVSLELNVDLLEWTGAMEYTIYVRRGEYVHHDNFPVGNGGFSIARAADYDASFEVAGDSSITLDASSELPLEPGETYFFSITSRPIGFQAGYRAGEVTVTGSADIIPVADDPDDEDPDGEGCEGCSTGGSANPLWGLLLLGALRRRR